MLPTQVNCMVYLVLDEIQDLYDDGRSPPRYKSPSFWLFVKLILSNAGYNVRILMFAGYGTGLVPSTPLEFDKKSILGIDHLNFTDDEISSTSRSGSRAYRV
ncbi:hypothetical protein V7S43_018083 [Phytophthora oleae]|uniref:Uncharacterized protein n=1 Tax=Phytophthora oleae TaxID=2107226 RepID=A0ABD3ESE7_9STRA